MKVDDRPIDSDVLYVAPGRHEVHIEQGGEKDDQAVTVAAGAVVSVAFHAQPIAQTPPAPATPPPVVEREPEQNGISPTFVWIGAGLTAAAAGFAIWSGIDTLNALDEYNSQRTTDGLIVGKSKELRTNVLFAVTGGLGALTAVTAIFLVDWKTPRTRTSVSAGPGALFVTVDY